MSNYLAISWQELVTFWLDDDDNDDDDDDDDDDDVALY